MSMINVYRLKVLISLLSAALALTAAPREKPAGHEVADLVLKKVQVERTKADGSSWDTLFGKPDLKVYIRCGRKRLLTPVRNNVYEASYNVKAVRVRPGDVVRITVRDQDVALDDIIGRFSFTVTAEHLEQGRVTWGGFGRVKAVEIEFRR